MRSPCLAWMLLLAGLAWWATAAAAQDYRFQFDESLIPRFNIPRTAKPPAIDGTIGAEEWRAAVKVMGVAWTSTVDVRDRPISFWVAWDAGHLYLAVRSDILPGHRLYRAKRETYTAGTVFDDAVEIGLDLHDRNRKPNEVSSFLKFVINSLGSGEYMKLYPSIGQNLFNWRPNMRIANGLHEESGRRWWDIEIAASLDDLQMPVPNKAGDPVGVLLAADLKNPEWQWLDVPSATGHLEHYGFPRAILTADKPYVQVEVLSGFHDKRLDLRSAVYNPGAAPVKVKAVVRIVHGKVGPKGTRGLPQDPAPVVSEEKVLDVPAGGSARVDVSKAFPDLADKMKDKEHPEEFSAFDFQVTLVDAPDAAPVYTSHLSFWGTDKSYLAARPRDTRLEYDLEFNPVRGLLYLSADTLDAPIPEGAKAAGATYAVSRDSKTVKEGRLANYSYHKYDDLVELPALAPGKYQVRLALVDAAGKELTSRDDISIEKKDEAKAFARWWGNRIGDTEKVLQPFEPLEVKRGLFRPARFTCTRRAYTLDGLGLPREIQASGGPVLAAPARIIAKVGGKEVQVPLGSEPKVTSAKDWRIKFEGRPAKAAGLLFTSRGTIEQDGLVELALTVAPQAGPVDVEELRLEWPVDDSLGLYVNCVGQGGNYGARFIGKVPPGQGEVWDTIRGIGLTGTGMTAGSFTGNLWLGTEVRGLLWCADSDRGWDVDDKVPAHSLVREKGAVVLRNHVVGTYPGKKALRLEAARTITVGFNATPFRRFEPGWRLNQISAANGFSGGKYKVNWDTGQDFFSILSPPFADLARWPEYYAHCLDEATKRSRQGLYRIDARLGPYLTNQIALRGYMDKTVEPGVYDYFAGDWVRGNEVLSPTYTDYMTYLMDRQVRKGGCTHFYFDITFAGTPFRNLAAGLGYRLPDGRLQPELGDGNLRRWYQRVWAMMQENNRCPGGVSGHSTNGICLKALPFADSILDSEYPMKDPISVYPSERMIAGSCPHAFGVNISHLGFMNPNWPAMHDAVTGGGGGVFWHPDFLHWGIGRDDVCFVPYWRNAEAVRDLTPGVFASLWRRPGSVVLGFCNYGPDEDGKEQTRPVRMTLDLRALGVPAGAAGERLRVRQFADLPAQERYVGHLKWYQDLPGEKGKDQKAVPPFEPRLDSATGTLDGFDLRYHDVRFVVLRWEDGPVDDRAWRDLFPGALRAEALDWGIAAKDTVALGGKALDESVRTEGDAVRVQAWKRPGSVLLRFENPADKPAAALVRLDLARLGTKLDPKKDLWRRFTQVYDLQHLTLGPWNPGVQCGWWDEEKSIRPSAGQPGRVAFDARHDRMAVHLGPRQVRCVSIDTTE